MRETLKEVFQEQGRDRQGAALRIGSPIECGPLPHGRDVAPASRRQGPAVGTAAAICAAPETSANASPGCHCQLKIPQFLPIEISPDLYLLISFSLVTGRTFGVAGGGSHTEGRAPFFAHPPCWPALASTPAFFLSFNR